MPDKLEEFLCLLAEKRDWKGIRETASAIGLPEEKLRPITLFFERFGFISFDLEGERVRINPEVLKFLDGLEGPQRSL